MLTVHDDYVYAKIKHTESLKVAKLVLFLLIRG